MFSHIDLPADFLSYGNRAWVITGGQSGPGAVPLHPDWIKSQRDRCASAGVAFHHKQWGEFGPNRPASVSGIEWGSVALDGSYVSKREIQGWAQMYRVGKKAAGHLIDGVEVQQFPLGGKASPQLCQFQILE
jgi:hypothetical protein